MNKPRTKLHFSPFELPESPIFRTGVSLHSHTMHSKEKLTQLPQYLVRMPIVAQFLEWENERHHHANGEGLDFSRAYWRGRACARTAYDLEWQQIERLGIRPIVSLTDHDNIDPSLLLQNEIFDSAVPISVEWTAPYENTVFHLGIHNLRARLSVGLLNEMAAYTATPRHELLTELLDKFDRDPGMLVVFNHPLWDIGGVGYDPNANLARKILREFKKQIHAVEINGMRSWQENLGAMSLAEESGHPIVSGGDRHGLEPNALLNLTGAMTFADFIAEVREDRSSNIAVLPQYSEPLPLRHLACAWDAVREHQHLTTVQIWSERVFVRCYDGIERPLSQVWAKNAHQWIDPCLKMMGILASPHFRGMVRWAFQPKVSPIP